MRVIRRFDAGGIFVEIQDCEREERTGIFHYPNHTIFCLRQAPEDLPIDVRFGNKQVTRGGRLTVVPANVALRPSFIGRHRTALIGFETAYLEARGYIGSEALSRYIEDCDDICDHAIEYYLRQMVIEAEAPTSTTPQLLEALGSAVMLTTARYFEGNASGRVPKGELPLERIRNHVEANIRDSRIADLAALSGVSVRHFSRMFKDATGLTFRDYVSSVRLKLARKLLIETDWPVKDISYRLGFAHPSTFATAFRRHSGQSPGTIRTRRAPDRRDRRKQTLGA